MQTDFQRNSQDSVRLVFLIFRLEDRITMASREGVRQTQSESLIHISNVKGISHYPTCLSEKVNYTHKKTPQMTNITIHSQQTDPFWEHLHINLNHRSARLTVIFLKHLINRMQVTQVYYCTLKLGYQSGGCHKYAAKVHFKHKLADVCRMVSSFILTACFQTSIYSYALFLFSF